MYYKSYYQHIVGSPIRGFERNGNDDLPAIVEEEALSSDLPSEVHVHV